MGEPFAGQALFEMTTLERGKLVYTMEHIFKGDAALRAKVIFIYLFLAALNIGAWAWALISFHNQPVMLGTSLFAYTLGLRHAVDADHIAAIDNVTRKLMQEGKKPAAVGFFVSIGHSLALLIGVVVIALTAMALADNFNTYNNAAGIVGTVVSTGFLFGLGFDTATEVALLGIASTRAMHGMSLPPLLAFPLLFAAGMSLIDTTDGIMMLGAYNWAFVKPVRKLYYNLTIMLVSTLVYKVKRYDEIKIVE